MRYPLERPEGAPDVWKREDFVYTSYSSDRSRTAECDRPMHIGLCEILDQLIDHEREDFPPIDKKYYRIRVLTLFQDDPLRAAEIIDAYNLSE